jgi:acetyl esterase/lipase
MIDSTGGAILTPPGTPTPAILYIHGGGHVSGSVPAFRKDMCRYAYHTQTPVFAPGYRLAPEYPHPKALEDVLAALAFLVAHGEDLRIDPTRIGILGVSAGGGLAVAAALMTRKMSLEPAPKKLVLVAPMLDDKTKLEEGSTVREHLTWTERHNQIAWTAYKGGDVAGSGLETETRCTFVAPARAGDMRGLPSTYIDVGGLDLFRRECMEFAEKLASADVEVEFHLYPGVPHAWDWVAAHADVTRRAFNNRLRVLKDL